jgi:hypothetical protein
LGPGKPQTRSNEFIVPETSLARAAPKKPATMQEQQPPEQPPDEKNHPKGRPFDCLESAVNLSIYLLILWWRKLQRTRR